MSRDRIKAPSYHTRRPRRSIKLDKIQPGDYLKYVKPEGGPLGGFFCDACSHFDSEKTLCTIGYKAVHTVREQTALYERSGQMALCRFLEID
jgi:hypothetical protein